VRPDPGLLGEPMLDPVHRAARDPQGSAGAPDNRLVAQLDGHLTFHHAGRLTDPAEDIRRR
jgi:hypothetical protein